MMEIFKTNVQEAADAAMLSRMLLEHFPQGRVAFDLEDCDRILKIVGDKLHPDVVIQVLSACGYHCQVLD